MTKSGLSCRRFFQEKPEGFTLIEIIIVFTLIGILVGLGIPQYRTAVQRSREAALKKDLYEMRILINQYYTDKQAYPAELHTLVEEGYLRSIPEDPMTKSSDTWVVIRETPQEQEGLTGALPGITDVISGSEGIALNGTPYNTW